MLRMAQIFFFMAVVAAMFGFGLVAGFTYDAAKILSVVCLLMAVYAFLADAFQARSIDPA